MARAMALAVSILKPKLVNIPTLLLKVSEHGKSDVTISLCGNTSSKLNKSLESIVFAILLTENAITAMTLNINFFSFLKFKVKTNFLVNQHTATKKSSVAIL
jgi:hypothetical protein